VSSNFFSGGGEGGVEFGETSLLDFIKSTITRLFMVFHIELAMAELLPCVMETTVLRVPV
jgi:hypothetical protein